MNFNSSKYCVVDAGNTQLKIVEFEQDQIVQSQLLLLKDTQEVIDALKRVQPQKSILSSVLNLEDTQLLKEYLRPAVFLSKNTPLPITITDYDTPQTLGPDRIANAVAAHHFATTDNTLVIDAGTCITFDLITRGRYQGGSISPGYEMRFKAMHQFTGVLPRLNAEKMKQYIGKSTKMSMLSGVMNGIQAEINTFVNYYSEKYAPLTIFLTGGDHKRFEIVEKNSIFADINLTVKGLYLILKHNV